MVTKIKADILIFLNILSLLSLYLLFLNALEYMKSIDLLVIEFCFLFILVSLSVWARVCELSDLSPPPLTSRYVHSVNMTNEFWCRIAPLLKSS